MRVFATGPRKGKTFSWGSSAGIMYQFNNGICEIPDNAPDLVKYLKVNLQIRTEFENEQPVQVADDAGDKATETEPVRLAILGFDPGDDNEWTEEGLPAVSALEEYFPNITRKQIEAVASDLTREVVRTRRAQA